MSIVMLQTETDALMHEVYFGNTAAVKLLIARGVNINIQDKVSNTIFVCMHLYIYSGIQRY